MSARIYAGGAILVIAIILGSALAGVLSAQGPVSPNTKEIQMTVSFTGFSPARIEVNVGDTVILHITSLFASPVLVTFASPDFSDNIALSQGPPVTVQFVAKTAGSFPIYLTDGVYAEGLLVVTA